MASHKFAVLDEQLQSDRTSTGDERIQINRSHSEVLNQSTTDTSRSHQRCAVCTPRQIRWTVFLIGGLCCFGILVTLGFAFWTPFQFQPSVAPTPTPVEEVFTDDIGTWVRANLTDLPTTVHCTYLGEGNRTRVCEIENLCISSDGIAFVMSDEATLEHTRNTTDLDSRTSGPQLELLDPDLLVPPILVNSVDEYDDWWWRPHRLSLFDTRKRFSSAEVRYYRDMNVLVGSSYASFHMTHFLFNTALPFIDRLLELRPELQTRRWAADAAANPLKPWGMLFTEPELDEQGRRNIDFFLGAPFNMKMLGSVRSESLKVNTSATVQCFKRAHVGLGSRCAIVYCDRLTSQLAYRTLRSAVLAAHVPTEYQDEAPPPRNGFGTGMPTVPAIPATPAATESPPSHCNPPLSALPFVTLVNRLDRPLANIDAMQQVLQGLADQGRLQYTVLPDEGIFVEHNTSEQGLRANLMHYCNTSIMISVHGNSFGNMLWMPAPRFTIEYTPFLFDTEMVLLLAEQVGHRHQLFPCRSDECHIASEVETQPNAKMRSTIVDIPQFAEAVERALVWYDELRTNSTTGP